VLISRVI